MSDQYTLCDGDWIKGREAEYRRLTADLFGDRFDHDCEIAAVFVEETGLIRVMASDTGQGWHTDDREAIPDGWSIETVAELLEEWVYFRPVGIEDCPDEEASDDSE
jgi:hypothetical protein